MSKTLEREIEDMLIAGVGRLGGLSFKFTSPGTNGVPDRLNFFPGGLLSLVETKTADGGKVDPLQKVMHRMLMRIGFPVTILDTKEKVKKYLAFYENLIKQQSL